MFPFQTASGNSDGSVSLHRMLVIELDMNSHVGEEVTLSQAARANLSVPEYHLEQVEATREMTSSENNNSELKNLTTPYSDILHNFEISYLIVIIIVGMVLNLTALVKFLRRTRYFLGWTISQANIRPS